MLHFIEIIYILHYFSVLITFIMHITDEYVSTY